MSSIRYRLAPSAEGWSLFCDTERLGRFKEEAAALRAAQEIAHSCRVVGLDVELLVENRRGDIRMVDLNEAAAIRAA